MQEAGKNRISTFCGGAQLAERRGTKCTKSTLDDVPSSNCQPESPCQSSYNNTQSFNCTSCVSWSYILLDTFLPDTSSISFLYVVYTQSLFDWVASQCLTYPSTSFSTRTLSTSLPLEANTPPKPNPSGKSGQPPNSLPSHSPRTSTELLGRRRVTSWCTVGNRRSN